MSARRDTNSVRMDNTSVSDSAFAVGTGASAANRSTSALPAAAEIAELRRLIAQEHAAGALADDVANDASGDLDDLEQELARPNPDGSRLSRLLRRLGGELGAVAAVGSAVAAVITAVKSFTG